MSPELERDILLVVFLVVCLVVIIIALSRPDVR